MARMLHTLGGLHLEGAARQQAGPLVLLSYLALEGPQERRSVQELFFPGHADAAGRLRMMLHRLKQVAPGALETPGSGLHTPLASDAAELLRAAERQEAAQVIALYRGRFLDGVRLPGDQELEEWVFATRERLAARVRSGHLVLGQDALARHENGPALTHAERAYLLSGAPEPEQGEARLLALLLTATGSAFAADARAESRHLGLSLPEQAGAAAAELLQDRGAPALPAPPASPDRRAPPRRRAQDRLESGGALPTVAQAPESTEQGAEVALPALLGREDLLARIEASYEAGARLVTLLGPGGIGKTLLARHALSQAQRGHLTPGMLPGLMIDLSAVSDASGVLPAMAAALQARSASLQDVAQAARGSGRLLLDNFEQVLPAAADLDLLLDAVPQLQLLVTSRERLHLAQEHVLPLSGLSLHLPEGPGAQPGWSDAARLFVRRATRAHLGFVPGEHRPGIEEVCMLVRGVPLLIELASAWVRTLSPGDIAAQLDTGRLQGADLTEPDLDLLETRDRGVQARHASARTVLQASWQRLDPAEQRQLARLAVFLSDFTVRAARQVTGATLSSLANLTDKSWLGSGPAGLSGSGRLSWHPMARAFVREASGDWPSGNWKEVLHPHAHYYAQGLESSRFQAESLAEVLGEWPDIGQAARTLALFPDDWPTLIRLAREVPRWADQVGNYASVSGLIGRVLDVLPADAAPRGYLLRARAVMRRQMQQLTAAAEDYRAAAALLLQRGDEQETMQGLDALAALHYQAGEHAQAQTIWQDLLLRAQALEMLPRQAYILQCLAVNALDAGWLSEAESWIREAVRAEQRVPLRPNQVLAYSNLGRILTRLERRAEAHLALTEALRLAHELQSVNLVPAALNFLALNLLEMQRPEEAVRLCLEALKTNPDLSTPQRAEMLDTLALCYGRSGETVLAREALARCVQLNLQHQDVGLLLHRLASYAEVCREALGPVRQAAVLHWLLGHERADPALRENVLKLVDDAVTPAGALPPLDMAVYPAEAQRLCGYVPGASALALPLLS